MTKPTKWHVRPAKTRIILGIRPVWSVFPVRPDEESLGPQLPIERIMSEDSGQTGRMPSLIWVFNGRTCHYVLKSSQMAVTMTLENR